ncbi:hypothetical protein [Alteromonas sp. S015]|uniref:hypothetical protein n=1 Tax=Alteromonas sp. S015 TaxID=3117401 RepID=UPI002FE1E735
MQKENTITLTEMSAIANSSYESILELANMLQGYIWESDIKLESKHDSVISALINQIKSECSSFDVESH